MTSSEPKAQISIKQPLLLGVKRNLTCFQQIPCFLSWSLILDWKDSENCCTFQLKLHDLVDLDQLPSPSLFFKLNRHNYSNLLWQSSHCTFSPFPSPPLQPLVLHVSRTVHNSRYGGITIVYRKKNNVTFHPHPDDIQFLLAPPNTSKNFKGKDQRQIPGAPQHWAEHKAAMVSCLAFFLP